MSERQVTKGLPWWKALMFSVIPIVLILAAAEGILAARGYPPRKTLAATLHDNSFWITQANLDKSPFLHKEVGTDFLVSTNSRSMRYGEIPEGRQDKTLRIVALGDSTTFGWGVEQDLTYPARLEAKLKGKIPGVDIESINGGVPGYSSFQGIHHINARVLTYQPDIWLIGYIVQDARRAPVSDKDQAIANRSAEFLRANPLYQWRTYLFLREKYQVFRSERREEEAKTGETWRVPVEDYRDNLKEIVKVVRANDGIPVLFGFPLEVVGYTKEHREALKALSEELKTPWVDFSPELAEAARKETLYFPQDRGHPNAAGCEVIATYTAEWLEKSGVLKAAAERRGLGN